MLTTITSGTIGTVMVNDEQHLPALVSLADAASYLGVSPRTLRRGIKAGNPLGAVKVGGTYRVRREVLEAMGRPPVD
jgi:excisionase family DNA binding protein